MYKIIFLLIVASFPITSSSQQQTLSPQLDGRSFDTFEQQDIRVSPEFSIPYRINTLRGNNEYWTDTNSDVFRRFRELQYRNNEFLRFETTDEPSEQLLLDLQSAAG